MNTMEINEVIHFFRKQKGWTQRELAEKMHMSEKTISAYETGTRGVSTPLLEEFAKVFKKQTKEFFDHYAIANEKEIFESNGNIIWVEYVSFWDGGYAEIVTKAKYNIKENTVYDVEVADVDHLDLENCEREYIILPDGTEKDVIPYDEFEEYEEEWKRKEMVKMID